jgi:hypothetical protein
MKELLSNERLEEIKKVRIAYGLGLRDQPSDNAEILLLLAEIRLLRRAIAEYAEAAEAIKKAVPLAPETKKAMREYHEKQLVLLQLAEQMKESEGTDGQ